MVEYTWAAKNSRRRRGSVRSNVPVLPTFLKTYNAPLALVRWLVATATGFRFVSDANAGPWHEYRSGKRRIILFRKPISYRILLCFFVFFSKITEKTKKLFSFAFRHSFVFVDFEPSRLATSDRIDTVLPSFTCFDLRRRIRIIGSHTAVAWQRSKADEFISSLKIACNFCNL